MASQGPFSNPSNFSHPISIKLDEKNFRQWKQQVEGIVKGHKLDRFITRPRIPLRYASDSDRDADIVNPLYTDWEQHDALVATWLLSSISDSLLSRVVDCTYSWQIWDEIHKYYHSLLITKARQLRSELRTLTKGDRKIGEFLLRVRTISDSLLSLGDPMPHRNLLEITLEALPEEFDSVVTAVNSRSDLCTLDELESLLLVQEARLEKNKKSLLTEPISVNLAQAPQSNHDFESFSNPSSQGSLFPEGVSHTAANDGGYRGNGGYNGDNRGDFRGGRNGGYRGGRNGGFPGRGGRSGRRSSIQCQICKKYGHDASVCYHCNTSPFSEYYTPAPPYGFWQSPRAPSQQRPPMHFRPPLQYHFNAPPRPQHAHAHLTGVHPVFQNQPWYPDSGATHHATPDPTNMSDSSSMQNSEQVFMGNGQGFL